LPAQPLIDTDSDFLTSYKASNTCRSIELREAHAARSLDIEEEVTVDLDEKNGIGRVGILPALGIEILKIETDKQVQSLPFQFQ